MTTAKRTMTSVGRRAVLGTALAMALSAIGPAGAAKAEAAGDLVDLTVVDRTTGEQLRTWRHHGRLFVAGQPGARYSLRVANHTDGRVLVVMSVDGVNILTGETAAYGQRGYVFDPYQSYDVSGWRKSDTEVAAFTFAPLPQSYAARTGRPVDVGVIGIAAFKERVFAPVAAAPVAEPSSRARSDPSNGVEELVVTGQRNAPSPAARPPATARMAPFPRSAAPSDAIVAAERRAEKLGTGHGAREWSVTYTVPFERATAYPQLIRRIEYDTFDNLVASGVIPRPWDGGRRPRPFPSNGDEGRYVPDPPGRP
jgi:hypothetical protein